MTLGEAEPNPMTDHILDWLEGSVSFFPTFLDDPYNSDDYQWWEPNQEINQDVLYTCSNNTASNTIPTATASTTTTASTVCLNPTSPGQRLKRKSPEEPMPRPSLGQNLSKSQSQQINEADAAGQGKAMPAKKLSTGKKGSGKPAGRDCNNANGKDGRWAEQLLNPCASAITAGNGSRIQHLLYVLHELASPSGDPNHRLASHGLRALTYHLSSSMSITSTSVSPVTFASSEPRFFRKSLLNFNDHSPWFALPSNIANSSILQVLGEVPDKSSNLHIVDLGVSHGAQWPTLLDGLSRSPGGPPPLVRLTIISASTESDTGTPFSLGPPGYDYSLLLLDFAKKININLQINRLDNHPIQKLDSNAISTIPGETLIVCAQFRLHHLDHNIPDERSSFLKAIRNLEPKGVILSENNAECSCANCADFATSFSRKVEYLWRFLDSASATYKSRESNERRMMEGEAAKALFSKAEMNEGKDKWCERMREAGFSEEAFRDDVIDGARALLRKHDSNWEMRVEEKDGYVSLWWKGQPVSFCSLWKLGAKV
ncbi:protein NODULATION SIGNALING PATHWAY 1 [Punica granatum]|uniref:Uncharacterized protein n=2 Tax=Punica granatum TaxID=22663 RepID=A0A218W1Q1_PUNGR|nr:protein NODULATION SIGNALING PATHWAY 1 [Punica granatum]OWM66576.1 hypothetical protein CDL15_Pgr013793 [Punica granatum]PKI74285.1 hypothetical protein CRG98_005342 [Punica granatum]